MPKNKSQAKNYKSKKRVVFTKRGKKGPVRGNVGMMDGKLALEEAGRQTFHIPTLRPHVSADRQLLAGGSRI
jgi:hypothetical protein